MPPSHCFFSVSSAICCVLIYCGGSMGLIDYDYSGSQMNITTISLLGVGDCNLEFNHLKTEDIYIQLLQLSDFEFTPFLQCKISISRTASYCGMHSHISAVHNGYAEYIREVPYQQCERMHHDGVLSLPNGIIIDDLLNNATITRSVVLAGKVNNDGSCEGASYSDPYGNWDKVLVQAIVKITLKSGFIPVKMSTGKVTLKSGTVCALNKGSCLDVEDGYTYWHTIPSTTCNFEQYDVLYEGNAQKTYEEGVRNIPTIYLLTTQDVTFALTQMGESRLCGYTLLKTEYPKLFIMETRPGNNFIKAKTIPIQNLDIFTYVNSKFVYVEKHIRTQVTTMYEDIMTHKCELEKQVITNAMALAQIQPEEFAYTLMNGPGYMAVTAGEAMYLLKCVLVEVELRQTQECYNELPVTFKNDSYYLHPKSHVLRKIGAIRECNSLLPVMYQIDENWIRFLPRPIDAPTPSMMKPRTGLTWKYMSPGKLATNGIYTQKDIDNLREHIMFSSERPAMINNVVQVMSGKQSLGEGMSAYNLLDEKTLSKITANTANKIWNNFITFGSASAGLLAIVIIIRLIKLVLDTLIQGYALHSVYGCGIHLIAAIWSSVTHLLLHRANSTKSTTSPPGRAFQEEENNIGTYPTTPPLELQAPRPHSKAFLEHEKTINQIGKRNL